MIKSINSMYEYYSNKLNICFHDAVIEDFEIQNNHLFIVIKNARLISDASKKIDKIKIAPSGISMDTSFYFTKRTSLFHKIYWTGHEVSAQWLHKLLKNNSIRLQIFEEFFNDNRIVFKCEVYLRYWRHLRKTTRDILIIEMSDCYPISYEYEPIDG